MAGPNNPLASEFPGIGHTSGLRFESEVQEGSQLATAQLADSAVTAAKLAANAVETAKILDANVTLAKLAANSVDTTKITKDLVRHARIVISTANILAMNGAPVQLVAAPGANRILIPVQFAFKFTYAGVQYANGGAMGIYYDTGAVASATVAAALINGTADFIAVRGPADGAAIANKGLMLSNATAPFITGTSGGVLDLWYRDIDLTALG